MLTAHTQPNKLEKKDFIFNTLCQIKGSKWIKLPLRTYLDLLYKMVIAVKCVYNKPVFDFLNMIKLIENVNRIPVIVQLTFWIWDLTF